MAESCEIIMPMLSAYLDGELSDAEAKIVEAHIAECEYCAMTLESYRAINSETMLCTPPSDFTEKVMAKINAEPKKKEKKIIPFRYGTLAAAMVALVLLGASGSFDRFMPGNSKSAAYVVDNAAAEMETALEEKAEGIMSYSAAFGAAPAAEAPAAEPRVIEEAAPAEPAPVPEEAPAEPAAPAPESRTVLTTADTAVNESGVAEGAPLAPETEETAEESVEAESEIIIEELTGMVSYVEPAEGGCYIKVENNGEETTVYLPITVIGEIEPDKGEEISIIAEQTFDGYEYHYVALEIEQ